MSRVRSSCSQWRPGERAGTRRCLTEQEAPTWQVGEVAPCTSLTIAIVLSFSSRFHPLYSEHPRIKPTKIDFELCKETTFLSNRPPFYGPLSRRSIQVFTVKSNAMNTIIGEPIAKGVQYTTARVVMWWYRVPIEATIHVHRIFSIDNFRLKI